MASSGSKRQIAEALSIVVGLLNLGEKLFVYKLTQSTGFIDEHQYVFVAILLGFDCLSILKALTKSERIQISISALIEVLEVIIYCGIFCGSSCALKIGNFINFQPFLSFNSVLIIIVVLGVIELTLLVTVFIIVPSAKDNNTCTQGFINVIIETILILFMNLEQALPLFIPQFPPRFREPYYEILVIVTFFMTTNMIGYLRSFNLVIRNYVVKRLRLLKKIISCHGSIRNLFQEMKTIDRELSNNVKKELDECYSSIGRYWFYIVKIAELILFLLSLLHRSFISFKNHRFVTCCPALLLHIFFSRLSSAVFLL